MRIKKILVSETESRAQAFFPLLPLPVACHFCDCFFLWERGWRVLYLKLNFFMREYKYACKNCCPTESSAKKRFSGYGHVQKKFKYKLEHLF